MRGKRKKNLPATPNHRQRRRGGSGSGGSSGSGKRSYSEAELEELLEKKVKKLKADEEKADADLLERMQDYEKSKGYVSIAPEELKKLDVRELTIGKQPTSVINSGNITQSRVSLWKRQSVMVEEKGVDFNCRHRR